MERFAAGTGTTESADEAKKKIAERKARFGNTGADGKVDKLELSLDEIKTKMFKKKFKGQGFKNKNNNNRNGGKPKNNKGQHKKFRK